MSTHAAGRHRAPGRLNPLKSFSSAVKRSTRPAVTASLAAGGLMAAMAGPASAAPAAPAPAADAVVLSGNASSKVTYGLSVVTKAPAKSSTTFKGVSFVARPSPTTIAARAAATAPRAATATVTAATRTVAARTPATRTAATAPRAAAAAAPRSGVLGLAASLSGIPYRWGGTTPAGFDCSGYVQYVFRQAGVSLPRTAGAQRAATIPVRNPQPGDLVFFGTWHVGIYAGNGMMYDSPTAGQTTGLHKIWSNDVAYGRVR